MSTYIDQRSYAFRDAMGDAESGSVERKRSDARLKTYDSCTDTRAWCIEDEQRRQFMLNLVRATAKKGQICPKYIPIQVISDLLLASKNAEIDKLQIQLSEFQKLFNLVEGGDEEQSEYGSAVEDIEYDMPTLKQMLLEKEQEMENQKSIALAAITKLEGLQKIMDRSKRKLTQSRLKIASLEREKTQQARVLSSMHLLDLSALEEEMAILNNISDMSPEQETENIKKQIDVLKRYYDKVAVIQEENVQLKKENAFYRSQLRKYTDEESEIELHTRMLEDELTRSVEQIRTLESRVVSTREAILESAEMHSLRQRSQMLDEVESERNYLARRLERLSGMEEKLIRIKARADEADMLEQENRRLLKQLEELQRYRRVSDYQAKDIELLRSEAYHTTSSLGNIIAERDLLRKQLNEMSGCQQALRSLEMEHSECSCIKAERDMLKNTMPDIEKMRKELDEIKKQQEEREKKEEEEKDINAPLEDTDMFVIEIEMVTLIEVIDDLSLQRDILTRRSGDLECVISDQEDEIKTLVSHVEELSNTLQINQDKIYDGLEVLRTEIEEKSSYICTAKLMESLAEKENKISILQSKLLECNELTSELKIVREENNKLKQITVRSSEICSSDHVGKLLFECKQAVAIITRKVKICFSQKSSMKRVHSEDSLSKLSNALHRAHSEISKLQNRLKNCEARKIQEELLAENKQLRRESIELKNITKSEMDHLRAEITDVRENNQALKGEITQIKQNNESLKEEIIQVQQSNEILKSENERFQVMIKGIEENLETVRCQLGGTITCTCVAVSKKELESTLLEKIQLETFIRNLQEEINTYLINAPSFNQATETKPNTCSANVSVFTQSANEEINVHYPRASRFMHSGKPCTLYDAERCINDKLVLVKENVRLRSQITKIETQMRCVCENVSQLKDTNNDLEMKIKNLDNELNIVNETRFEDCALVKKLRSDMADLKCENSCLRNCLADLTGLNIFLETEKKDDLNSEQLEECDLVTKLRSELVDLKCENLCLRNCLADLTGSDMFLKIVEEGKNIQDETKLMECDLVGKLRSDIEDMKCENLCLRNCLVDLTGSESFMEKSEKPAEHLQQEIQLESPDSVVKLRSDFEDLKCENSCLRNCLKVLTGSESVMNMSDENGTLKAEIAELKETIQCIRTCVAFGGIVSGGTTIDLLKQTISKFESDIEALKCENQCLRLNLQNYTNEYEELIDELESTKTCQASEISEDSDAMRRLKSINDELKKKIKELEERLAHLKKEVGKPDVTKYDDEIQKLKEKIADLEKLNALLQTGLEDDSVINEYLNRIKELEKKIDELEKLNRELMNQLEKLQQEEEKLSAKQDVLSDNELEKQLRELKRKLNELENINKDQANRINEFENQASTLEAERRSIAPRERVAEEKVVDHILSDANLRITDLEKENNSLKMLIEKLENELRNLKKENQSLKEVIDIQDENLDADGRIANLKEQCDKRERELQDEIEMLKSKIQGFESEKKDLDKDERLANLKKQCEKREKELQDEIEKLKSKIQALGSEKKDIDTDDLRKKCAEREKQLEDEISKLLAKIKDLEIDQMFAKVDADDPLASLKKECKERETDLQNEIAKLKAQLKEREIADHSDMDNRIASLLKECSDKEKALQDEIAKLKSKIKDREGAEEDKSEIGNRLASLQKERDDREAELQNEIAKLKARIKDSESEGKEFSDKEKNLLDEIAKLKSLINDYESSTADTSERDIIARIKKEKEDREAELLNEIAKLKARIKELEERERDHGDKEKELQNEISKLKSKLMERELEKDDKLDHDNLLANLRKDREHREAELQNEITLLKAQIDNLENYKKEHADKEKQLQEEIARLNAKIRELESMKGDKSDVENLINRLKKEKEDRESELLGEISKLKSKIKELEDREKECSGREKELQEEISKLKAKLSDLESSEKQRSDKEKNFQDEIAKLNAKIKSLEGGEKDSGDREKDLEDEITKLKAKIKDLENQIVSLKNEKDAREAELKSEISKLNATIKDKESTEKERGGREKDLQDEITKLKAKINDLENQIVSLKNEKDAREAELKSEISKLNATIKDKESAEKERGGREKDLQDEISKLKSKINELENQMASIKKEKDAREAELQNEISKLLIKISELENEQNECKEKQRELQDENAKLKAKLKELEIEKGDNADLQNQIASLKKQKEKSETDLQNEISKLKSRIKELEDNQNRHNEKEKQLQDEIAKLNSKVKELENEAKKCKDNEKELQDEITNLKAKIKELEIEKGNKVDLENQIASLKKQKEKAEADSQDEISKLKSRIKELETNQDKHNQREKELQDEITQLKSKIDNLLNEQKKCNEKEKELQDEISKLKAKLEDCAKEEKKQNEREKELQDEIMKLKRKIEELTTEEKKHNEKEKASQDEITNLKAMIKNLENESKLKEQLEKQNKDLKDEIEKLKKQLAEQKEKMEKELKETKSKLEDQIAKLTKEKNEKEAELQNEILKLKSVNKDLENAEKQKTELEKQVKELQNEIAALKGKISDLEDENKKLKKQVETNADLENRITQLTKEKNEKVNDLEKEISNLKAKINNLENENTELEKQNSNLKKEIDNLKQKLADLEEKHKSLTKSESEKAEKEINDLKKQIEELKQKLAKLEEENKNLKKEIENLNKSKADLEKENSSLKQETKNLNDKISGLYKENADLKQEGDNLKDKTSKYEKDLDNMNRRSIEIDQDSLKLKAEVASLNDKIKSLEKENADLKQKLEKCYEQNEITKSERDAMEREKDAIKKDLDDLLDKMQADTGDDLLLQRERDEKNKLNDLIKQLQSQIKDLESNQLLVSDADSDAMQKLKDEIERLNKLREAERKELEQKCESKLKKLIEQYGGDVESVRKIQAASIISLQSSYKESEELQKLLAEAKEDLLKCKSKIEELESKLEAAYKELENERNRNENIKKSLDLTSGDTAEVKSLEPKLAEESDTDDVRCPCGAPISSRLYIAPRKDVCTCGLMKETEKTEKLALESPTGHGDLVPYRDITINRPSVTDSLINILTKALEGGLENLGYDELLVLHKKLKNAATTLNRNVNICGPPQETVLGHIEELEKELSNKQKYAKEKLAALQVVISEEQKQLAEAKNALAKEKNKYSDLVQQIDSKTREAASIEVERDLLRQQSIHREDLLEKLMSEMEEYKKAIINIEKQLAEERSNVKYLRELLENVAAKSDNYTVKAEKLSKSKPNTDGTKKSKKDNDLEFSKPNRLSDRTRSVETPIMKSDINRLRRITSSTIRSDDERYASMSNAKRPASIISKPKPKP